MNLNKKLLWALPAMVVIAFSSCKKDDPIIPNEEELITTVELTLTPTGSGPDVVFNFQDLDGDGGNSPIIDEPASIMANHDYSASIRFLNEAENPVENITEEVDEEGDEHQIFYQFGAGLNATSAYTDADANGNPIGLSTELATGDASTGTMTITLRHEPDKLATGVSNGDITNAGGETDIEVTFDVTIQ